MGVSTVHAPAIPAENDSVVALRVPGMSRHAEQPGSFPRHLTSALGFDAHGSVGLGVGTLPKSPAPGVQADDFRGLERTKMRSKAFQAK